MHKPVVLTRDCSITTLQFLNTLATNENLTSVVIEFIRGNTNSTEEPYMTIKLTNANIAATRSMQAKGLWRGVRWKTSASPIQKIEVTAPSAEDFVR